MAASPLLAISVTGGPIAFACSVERTAGGVLAVVVAFVAVVLILALIVRTVGRAFAQAALAGACPLPTFA